MISAPFRLLLVVLLSSLRADALVAFHTRREAISAGFSAASLALVGPAVAAEDNQPLSDDEMAARIAKKMALLNRNAVPSGPEGLPVTAQSIRSDINPEAAANLRARSSVENAKIALAKQKELKSRGKEQKREDLCEMLGRGC
mmetsp:Transcript_33302/g.76857  ORF Transcript_33302/g.76857 Transcript_33302/m.76857 type:complete len:143 (-) Transcript_33302:282-710(-)